MAKIQTYILSYDDGAEVDAILHKAEADYTKDEVDQAIANAISALPKPMIYESGMTLTADVSDTTKCSIAVVEPSSVSDIKKGYTYKVTAISGTYTGPIKVGDTFIAQKDAPVVTTSWVVDTDWTVVPSGDETGYIVGKSSGTTQGHLMTWGANGFTAEDAGVEVETNITDSDAKIPTSKAVKSAIENKLPRVIMDNSETQDYYLQNSTPANPSEGDYWFDGSDLVASDITAMTGYTKAQTASAIAATDTLNEAVGKLEKKADDNTSGLNNKQNQVLGSWTAGTATSHVTPTGTDTVLQALQKIDNNQRNDENNITFLTANGGGKNEYSVDATVTGSYQVDATKTGTGYQLSANGAWAHMDQEVILPSAGRYVISMTISNYNSNVSRYAPSIIICPTSSISAPYLGSIIIEGNGDIALTVETTNPVLYISYYVNRSATASPSSSFEASNVMVCSESEWAASHQYQLYAWTNAELTSAIAQNSEDILTLEEMNGAKNMLQYTLNDLKGLNPTLTWNNNVATISGGGCTFTVNNDMSIDVVATDSHTQANLTLPYYPLNKGNTVLMGCPSGGSSTTYKLGFIGFGYDTGNGINVPNQTSNNRVFIEISANKPLTGTYKPMIISKDVYDAGFTDYQRYAMTNAELTEKEKQNEADILSEQAKTTGMSEGGYDWITVGGIRLYVSATAPTGARTGDMWIGG